VFTFTFVSLRHVVSRSCGCARSMQLLSLSFIYGAQFENILNSNVNASNKHLGVAPLNAALEQRLYWVKEMP